MINAVPPIVSVALVACKFLLSFICLVAPDFTINSVIPYIFRTGENDGKISAVEQILVRLLGGVLLAYAMNSSTNLLFGCMNAAKKSSRLCGREYDVGSGGEDEVETNDNDTTYKRISLLSSTYLGMCVLLVVIFEILTLESNSNNNGDDKESSDEASFMNLLVIAAIFVIFALLGLIASFYTSTDDVVITENEILEGENHINNDDEQSRTFFGWCERRSEENTSNNDVEHNTGVDSTPLLRDENFGNDAQSNTTDSNSLQSEQTQEQFVGGRLRGTRRVLEAAGPHALYLALGCVVLLIRLPFSLSIPHFVSVTLVALSKGQWEIAKTNILFLFIFGTIDAALDFFCVFLYGLFTLKISRGLRLDLFRALSRQEIAFFDKNNSGDLASRLNADCGHMAADLTWFFRFSIESSVRISGIVLYMFLRAPKLALCAISVVPFVAFINKKYGDWLSKNARDVQTALAAANSVAQEALLCIRTVIAFASEQEEQEKYKYKIDEHYALNVKQLYSTGFYYMLISTFLINTCVQALILFVGMLMIRDDQMGADVLLAFMFYQSQLQNEVMNLFNSYTSLVKSSGAGDKVFELLDRVTPPPGTGSFEEGTMHYEENPHTLSGDIVINNLSFSYKTRQDEKVLNGLNLQISSGQTVALVGKSGCGKTTIYNLLQRFYDPNSGDISISGIILKDHNLKHLRQNVGIVTQDPVLFTGTIKANIAYATNEEITLSQIIEAAKLADAHEFIQSFPLGYETQIGERGAQLSGGQKQRIAIARALVRKPKLLLLDEATSALDSESEKSVQKAIENLLKTKREEMTTLIIAHRLSTVKNADKIFVIDSGFVVEEGSHDDLMENESGIYFKMIHHSLH